MLTHLFPTIHFDSPLRSTFFSLTEHKTYREDSLFIYHIVSCTAFEIEHQLLLDAKRNKCGEKLFPTSEECGNYENKCMVQYLGQKA